MTQAAIAKKLNKTADEMKEMIKKSKRKLLELEVMMSLSEIKRGKFSVAKNVDELLNSLK